MAYSKQTWTDDVSAVTGARMTHIEQGIYDNSLATDKINPSGTATTTAEIEEGQINDVIGFKSLKLKGQTSQYTTTGKNKLSLTIENKTAGGITLTKNNDNSYKISGTSTSLLLFNSSNTQTLTANTTYTLGLTNGNNDVQLSLRTSDGNTQYVKTEGTATSATFTPTTDIEVKLYVRIPSGVTVNETIFPIVVEGSTIGTYEPYTGGKASPNPDFPQDVNNVSGDNVVRISNKNLYDKDDSNLIMNNVYINATGFVLTSSNNMKTICMPCRANTTYTVSKTLSSRFIIGTASSNTIGTSMTAGRTNPSGTQVSVTSGANDKYLFVFYYHGSADTKTEQEIRNSIQVEIGTSATSFVAHQGNNFEINLGAIEICKISTYQDYIFKRDGKWYKYKAIGKKVLNGTETWTKDSDTSSNYYIIQNAITSTGNYADGLSNYFINAKAYPSGSTGKFAIRDSGTSLMFNSSETSVENWKTWLTTHNTSIYYPIATPIEEEITSTSLIRQLDELYNSGLYDVTNISQDNSSEAFILDLEACKNNINGIVEYIRR